VILPTAKKNWEPRVRVCGTPVRVYRGGRHLLRERHRRLRRRIGTEWKWWEGDGEGFVTLIRHRPPPSSPPARIHLTNRGRMTKDETKGGGEGPIRKMPRRGG